jgi:predicted NAD-dependent protein-ADP-ribosyltransferase YbiA (DUF1768 family)
MKVYGGLTFVDGKQVRTIVAAKSWTQAARLIGQSVNSLKQYWAITGNKVELETALSKPLTVFKASTSMANDFKAI